RLDLASVSLYLSAVVGFTTIMRTFSENLSIMLTDLKLSSTYFEMITDQSYYSEDQGRNALDEEIPIEIEFKNVSFRYPNTERYILKDFNFKIHAKEKLAIVGTNGAGKTTIVKLICGLFEPESGEILINGISMKEFCKQEYYKMFSAVFQDFEIYAGTILENVIGNDIDESSKKRGKMCLNRVGLKEKIESLPSGYDTPLVKSIDPEGVDLSGGQKQKIAIARALYKNGNVVILDEPTSALDALAEADIYQSFDDLVSNKTAIYISHRLSSTKFCDKIAFFDENGLQEYGTHEELMALKKGYYHMFEVQGQYYQEGVEKDGRKECFA
ncbi:ABC transporter ATP-binding protein, partial [Traorella massiliensis]